VLNDIFHSDHSLLFQSKWNLRHEAPRKFAGLFFIYDWKTGKSRADNILPRLTI